MAFGAPPFPPQASRLGPGFDLRDNLGVQALPVTKKDRIIIRGVNQSGIFTARIGARIIQADGEIQQFQVNRSIPTGDDISVDPIPLTDGWLVGASLDTLGGVVDSSLAHIELAIGFSGVDPPLVWALLNRGFVTRGEAISWPQTNIEQRGNQRPAPFTTVPTAALGGEIDISPGPVTALRLVALHLRLTTDATVANRVPEIAIDDPPGNFAISIPMGVTVTASSSQDFLIFPGPPATQATIGSDRIVHVPDLFITPGWNWATNTPGRQAGDQWTSNSLYYEAIVFSQQTGENALLIA